MANRALRPAYAPTWANAPVLRELQLDQDPALGDSANGARFFAAVQALQPGDRLVVGPGRWSVDPRFEVVLEGTAQAPIRIEARPGTTPIITRPDEWQNIINFGSDTRTPKYVLLRGFEITGGSTALRVYRGDDLWFDQCRIHHVGGDGVRASSYDTARLFVTRSEVHDTAVVDGTGEAFYLGSNYAAAVTRDSVVALNHVHHTAGLQGDGIELKQGSYGCLIAENIVHDTPYPGILAYGTGGAPRNVIEGNLIWGTASNPLQVQGEALVRNNLVFGGAQPAFASHHHQGPPRNLEVVHNTFVATSGDAAVLGHWANQPGMVLANNALYSGSGRALSFLNGANGVTVAGNVIHGSTYNDGGAAHIQGAGASDFVALSYDASRRDAHPSNGSALLGAAHSAYHVSHDLSGADRSPRLAAGAFEPGTYGRYLGARSPGGPWLRSSGTPTLGGAPVTIELEGGVPGNFAVIGVQLVSPGGGPVPGVGPLPRMVYVLDWNGSAAHDFVPPGGPAPGGGPMLAASRAQARDAAAPGGTTTTQLIEWIVQ